MLTSIMLLPHVFWRQVLYTAPIICWQVLRQLDSSDAGDALKQLAGQASNLAVQLQTQQLDL